MKATKTPPHGSHQRYWRGCKCERCRKAVAKYNYQQNKARAEGPAGIAFRADLTDPRHGTSNGYSNWRCRCDPCTAAWRVAHRPISIANRRRKGMKPWEEYAATVRKPHGTRGKYVKGCRCELCTRAAAQYQASYRKRKKEQTAA